jgi:hypothetical protein
MEALANELQAKNDLIYALKMYRQAAMYFSRGRCHAGAAECWEKAAILAEKLSNARERS